MSDNLWLYSKVREVPKDAQKPITGGRLNGKTDINPMWRLKILTEQFGPCGIGWKYEIVNQRLEQAPNGEIAAFVDINLYIKHEGEWSEAIPGTGGNMFVEQQRNGPYVNDECFKMALTDAISVSCKALGVGADVYWSTDTTKYDTKYDTKPEYKTTNQPAKKANKSAIKDEQPSGSNELERLKLIQTVIHLSQEAGWTKDQLNTGVWKYYGKEEVDKLSIDELLNLIDRINSARSELA